MRHNEVETRLLKSQIQRDIDFSGATIENIVLENYDLAESVFNGCHFRNVEFIDCNLSNTEHTETHFSSCSFRGCKLDACDFVYSNVSDCVFSQCTFSHVEWRESEYTQTEFEKCKFYNSTISLCIFRTCTFDDFSSAEMQGSSKRHNVFSFTKLSIQNNDLGFVLLNYGVSIPVSETRLPFSGIKMDDDFLGKLSLSKYLDQWSTPNFIENVVGAISQLSKVSSRGTMQRIKYIGNICKVTIEENRLTVFSAQLLIEKINVSVAGIQQPGLFMELAELILLLRTHQYRRIKEIEEDLSEYQQLYASHATFEMKLEETFTTHQIQKLIDACIEYQGGDQDCIRIISVAPGSTLVTGIIAASCSIGGFLFAINFALSQIKKTIVHVKSIKKELKGKKKNKRQKSEREYLPVEIMQSGNTIYYTQINNVVNKYGSDLIQIEGKGTVQINVKSQL